MRIRVQRKSKSKFRNKKCVVNGITFPSIKEGKRYTVLFYKQAAGEIFKLQLQTPFKILVNGEKICTYKADFTYYNKAGAYIVEDAKGVLTPIYKLKKRLLLITQGISITEV
jgi:hypothetical protein